MNRKKIILFASIWLALTIVSACVGLLVFDPNADSRFARNGIRSSGEVTAKEADNHRLVRYRYVVNGTLYHGIGSAGNGNPEFDAIEIGQQVLIFYDSTNPQESRLGYPDSKRRANWVGVIFVAFVLPLMFLGPIYAILRAARVL
jgi:hypothetical protein